jgi:hypothetical protein
MQTVDFGLYRRRQRHNGRIRAKVPELVPEMLFGFAGDISNTAFGLKVGDEIFAQGHRLTMGGLAGTALLDLGRPTGRRSAKAVSFNPRAIFVLTSGSIVPASFGSVKARAVSGGGGDAVNPSVSDA